MNKYTNYFKEHYRYNFSENNLKTYYKWFYSQFNIINKKLKIDYNKQILEIGSAIGGFYNFVKTDNYIGLELDKDAVEFANTIFNKNLFKNISFEEFITDKKFDYIFSFEVLEHMDNPDLNIQKIHDILNDDGKFIGTSPYPFLKNIFADKTHKYVLHPESWKRLFVKAGFKNVQIIPMSFLPLIWRFNKKINIRMPFYVPFKNFVSTCLIIASK